MPPTHRPLLFRLCAAAFTAITASCAHGVDPEGPQPADVEPNGGAPGLGGSTGNIDGSGGTPGAGGAGASSESSSGGAAGSTTSSGGTPSGGGPSGGGTSPDGGAPGTGAADAGTVVVDPILPGDVVVRYMPGTGDNGSIRPHLSIVNRGTKNIPLAQLTLRYWYTADGTPLTGAYQELQLDYAEIGRLTNGRTTVVLSFGPVMPPQPGADTYIEVGFQGPDSLGPGTMTVDHTPLVETKQIEVAAHWPGYTTQYDQTNDYSYDAKKTTYADWPKVTLYQNGVLVWGTEPDGTMPTQAVSDDAGTTLTEATDGGAPLPVDAGPG